MELSTYFSTPGAMTVAQLRAAMVRLGADVKSDAQIRQWQHKYKNRKPDPANARILELATGGLVSRRDTRPDDCHLIWPDLPATGDVAPQSSSQASGTESTQAA